MKEIDIRSQISGRELTSAEQAMKDMAIANQAEISREFWTMHRRAEAQLERRMPPNRPSNTLLKRAS